MITTAIILVILAALVGIIYGVIKIIDWWDARKRPVSNKAEFSADLYKLSQKWASKGEYDYAKGCLLMIESFSLPEIKVVETTAYGNQIKKEMEIAELDENAEF